MPAPTIADLTTATVTGAGVFDVLMKAAKAHLDVEVNQGRIKGVEYATVYLGSMELAMQTALNFLLQKEKAFQEAELVAKQILLVQQQTANALIEGQNLVKQGDVLVAQKCKLQAEYDLVMSSTTKTNKEVELLTQKVVTERAQTQAVGVDADSVIGKQKGLYQAQTDGFARDAEQKVADIMTKTWSVRRTTDEATVADGVNKLNDATVGRAVEKLLQGVGA